MVKFFHFLILVLTLAGCSQKVTEQQRVANPSGTFEAISASLETGSGSPPIREIYVVSKGSKLMGTPVLQAEQVDGLRLLWKTDTELVIIADAARVLMHNASQPVDVDGKPAQAVNTRLVIKELR